MCEFLWHKYFNFVEQNEAKDMQPAGAVQGELPCRVS